MIIFLKSVRPSDTDPIKIPLPEKLLMIFRARVEDAEDEEARERAVQELARVEARLKAK